jgi:HK97 family phage prohead protease
MKIKTCAAQIKAAGPHEGTEDGQFDAIVATYDLDSVGDMIMPGAFAETLAEWSASGDPIPVYWSHRMDDPAMCIGSVLNAQETEQGLKVTAQLDLDNPTAVQVYKLLKGRRVTQFSFAYDVEEGAYVEKADERSYYELRKLKLYEVGPTPIGANQHTELIDVKSGLTVEVHSADRAAAAAFAKSIRSALAELPDTAVGNNSTAPDAKPAEQPGVAGTGPTPDFQAKDGRRNSKADASSVQTIHDAATNLGAECEPSEEEVTEPADDTEEDAGKATLDTHATTEEPDGAKADVPAQESPASFRLRAELTSSEVEFVS